MHDVGFCYNRNVQDYETTPFVEIFYHRSDNDILQFLPKAHWYSLQP
jgi:hypothetical protein